MNGAYLAASKSKDGSTQVGCLIVGPDREVLTTGYNGFARGADDTRIERHQRPEKYFWTAHAERNAIDNAARKLLKGSTAYVTMFPCMTCANSLVQVGVVRVVAPAPLGYEPGRPWDEEHRRSMELFSEVGVQVSLAPARDEDRSPSFCCADHARRAAARSSDPVGSIAHILSDFAREQGISWEEALEMLRSRAPS